MKKLILILLLACMVSGCNNAHEDLKHEIAMLKHENEGLEGEIYYLEHKLKECCGEY